MPVGIMLAFLPIRVQGLGLGGTGEGLGGSVYKLSSFRLRGS